MGQTTMALPLSICWFDYYVTAGFEFIDGDEASVVVFTHGIQVMCIL